MRRLACPTPHVPAARRALLPWRAWPAGNGLTLALALAGVLGMAPALVSAQSGPPESAAPLDREPRVVVTRIEDDNARIDEVRVRGQTRSIVVQPNRPGARSYQVRPQDASREPVDGQTGRGGTAGQRTWSVISF